MTLEDLRHSTYYNRVRKPIYNAEGYLDGLTIVLFIVDPPYLATEAITYKLYWKLSDYLNILTILKDTNFVFFTSNKSDIVELCDWIEQHTQANSPFANAERFDVVSTSNYGAKS